MKHRYEDALVLAEMDRADGFIQDYYTESFHGWNRIIAIAKSGTTFTWFDEREQWRHHQPQVLQ